MSLATMKVGTRLGLGFGAVLLLLVIIGSVSIKDLSSLNKSIDVIVNNQFPKTVYANNAIDSINVIARAMRNSLLVDKAEIPKELARIVEERKKIGENLEKVGALMFSDEGKRLHKVVMDMRARYVVSQDKFIDLVKAGKQDEAKHLMYTETRPLQNDYINSVNKMIEFSSNLMIKLGKDAAEQVSSALFVISILGVIAIILGAVIGFMITRGLLKQLGGEPDYAAEAVHKIAGGDLSMDLTIKTGDTTSLMYSLKN
ncbi:MAG: MCP four helix bundle domain-containing protein, partial [Betaproteobacteria bacterium]|nr:MCP four helix bundle domain-containing protein [Betaproteobacteria bacterium]